MAEPVHRLILPDRAGERSWPAQGNWTYDDYRLRPVDSRRYEVLRGNLYVSAAPSFEHQRTVGELHWQLKLYLRDHDLGEVLVAPLDILLPREIATPVQPDIVFFRKGNQAPAGALSYQGVPDLVIEVLSPSTRRLDTQIKFFAYRDAGVPEVWFADPQAREIVVHVLSEDARRYVELCRARDGQSVTSRTLPGFRLAIQDVFPSAR